MERNVQPPQGGLYFIDLSYLDSIIAHCTEIHIKFYVFCYISSGKKQCETLKGINIHSVCLLIEWWSQDSLPECRIESGLRVDDGEHSLLKKQLGGR